MGVTLPELLDRHAALPGARLVFPEGALSYAEFASLSARAATGLAGLGIGRGDRVALWAENGVAWLATLFACARLGAIVVAVNSKFRSAELSDIVSRSGAKVIVLAGDDPVFAQTLAACETLGGLRAAVWLWGAPDISAALAHLEHVSFDALAAAAPMRESHAAPEAGCLVFTTSGTTSKPKFVLHAQRSLVRHGENVAAAAGITAGSVVFQVPPFCGTFGAATVFAALGPGAAHVGPRAFAAGPAAELIARARASHTMATNDGLAALFAADPAGDKLATLRYVGMAATNPVLGALCAEAGARGITVASMYGSSEVQAIVSLQPIGAPAAVRALQGGRLVEAEARVRVADPDSGRALPHGETGEIELRVGNGMLGYLGNEAATRAAFRPDGYFRTGDFGYTEADGGFVFLGRMGDSLRLGGFLVDPREIELEVERLPGVAQAQVVAIDTARGPRPVAFVIQEAGAVLDPAALTAALAPRLAKFKLPVRFHAVTDFPRVASANAVKVQKGKLREMAQALDPAP